MANSSNLLSYGKRVCQGIGHLKPKEKNMANQNWGSVRWLLHTSNLPLISSKTYLLHHDGKLYGFMDMNGEVLWCQSMDSFEPIKKGCQ